MINPCVKFIITQFLLSLRQINELFEFKQSKQRYIKKTFTKHLQNDSLELKIHFNKLMFPGLHACHYTTESHILNHLNNKLNLVLCKHSSVWKSEERNIAFYHRGGGGSL